MVTLTNAHFDISFRVCCMCQHESTCPPEIIMKMKIEKSLDSEYVCKEFKIKEDFFRGKNSSISFEINKKRRRK